MLGLIGGTGPEGRGLGLRFALAGEDVLIGSRDAERAEQAASTIRSHDVKGSVGGALNVDVARRAGTILVAVPYEGHRGTLTALRKELAGKLVIDVVAPLVVDRGRARAVSVEEGSAALQAQAILRGSTVAAAFQTISARDLLAPDRSIDSDVVVCADDTDAKAIVMELVEKIDALRAVDGGGLENARYVEDFTALLLNINRIYKAHSSLRIVGV